MLVLSRKPGESIVIGDGIEVRCLEVRGEVVRLGIVAPREVKVWRKELIQEVTETNVAAASVRPPEGWSRILMSIANVEERNDSDEAKE
ncbi:carbon storage regulator, CsrA [Thermanaerovibrio acidaminovorans DSM 6589]|uniref:Translational regulator CsrA n=1 Tax=Thermanaerovibrio acidaminovorans (strain ATCC 49978 / DSM 6589 / Su883) TaxID=525903 RepID=D1B9F1_THEAS|nr:carbon storage regulator CsrA [Thermanaerovibrio acidaminovorans]ACZ18904.1 carbon storage regulator, CsrA [Thermanaerovibrio acidaminovorans DSM 6589]